MGMMAMIDRVLKFSHVELGMTVSFKVKKIVKSADSLHGLEFSEFIVKNTRIPLTNPKISTIRFSGTSLKILLKLTIITVVNHLFSCVFELGKKSA